MKVKTTRFQELDIQKEDIVNFSEGILGFENLKEFFIVNPDDHTLILWLQSINDETTAFPIIEPKIFMPNYSVRPLLSDLEDLHLKDDNDALIYTILTIPDPPSTMSANLKAPIIINRKTKNARQIVLQDSTLEVRYKMYEDLKKIILNYSPDDPAKTTVMVTEGLDHRNTENVVHTRF